jgi:hypothetical protein
MLSVTLIDGKAEAEYLMRERNYVTWRTKKRLLR